MQLQACPATLADVDDLANVYVQATRNEAYFETQWLGTSVDNRLQIAAARLPLGMLLDGAYFIKAVEGSTNRTVGLARWTLPVQLWEELRTGADAIRAEGALNRDALMKEATEKHDRQTENGYAKGINVMLEEYTSPGRDAAKQRAFPEGDDWISLDWLHVLPEFRGQGIGKMMLDWGTALADDKGLTIGLESSPKAVGLYARVGFVAKAEAEHDLSPFGEPTSYTHTMMVRQPPAQGY